MKIEEIKAAYGKIGKESQKHLLMQLMVEFREDLQKDQSCLDHMRVLLDEAMWKRSHPYGI